MTDAEGFPILDGLIHSSFLLWPFLAIGCWLGRSGKFGRTLDRCIISFPDQLLGIVLVDSDALSRLLNSRRSSAVLRYLGDRNGETPTIPIEIVPHI